MDLNEIQSLIKFVAKSGVTEVELETGDFKINIKAPNKKKNGEVEQAIIQQIPASAPIQAMPAMPTPVAAAPVAPEPAPAAPAAPSNGNGADESKYVTINSPMIGTFYRKETPESDSFVEIGDDVSAGKVVCIIEAMKLFNEIESEISGKIVKVLVDDSTPVEYDQPLFLVDPS